jgi:CheY-like chemotaxis protein
VNNAAKYSPVGGRIDVTACREGPEIVLRFKDAGVGIPPDMLERIFEPFTQVHRPRDAALGGLGLGLALVKKLVELHGGTVRADSGGADRGSEFVVRLPALAAADAVPGRRSAEPSSGARRAAEAAPLRILVVDDVADAADSLARVLRFQGDAVQVANDGRAALDMVARQAPDVVFVDLQMPGMDGLEVARRLRAAPAAARMMLVAMTGFGQPEDHRQTAAAGFDLHLTKPVPPDVVQKLLARRRRTYLVADAAE